MACLLVSGSACVPMMAANVADAPAAWVLASLSVPAMVAMASLFAFLRQEGGIVKRILGILSRGAIAALGAVAAIAAFGLVAFLLELSLLGSMGTQAALSLLEALAYAGAVLLCPLAAMMFAGSYRR